MRKYYPGITLFKVVGSLLVLVGHVRLPLFYQRLTGQLPGLAAAMALVVPCFYCISGFLAYRGWRSAPNPDQYVRRYLGWLGGVYLGFCAVALAQGAARPWHLPVRTAVLPVFKWLCVTGPYPALWFVPPLLLSVAVVYACARAGRLRWAGYLAVAGFGAAQLADGTPRAVLETVLGPLPVYYLRYTWLAADALAAYGGIGFPFVLAGVLAARHEARFRQLPGRGLAAGALGALALELALLYGLGYQGLRLVLSVAPVGLWLFWGVLRIRLAGIRRHHAFLNRFSTVLYFLHLPLLALNLRLLGWAPATLTAGQSGWCVLLTAGQAWFLALALHRLLRRRAVPAPVALVPVEQAA